MSFRSSETNYERLTNGFRLVMSFVSMYYVSRKPAISSVRESAVADSDEIELDYDLG